MNGIHGILLIATGLLHVVFGFSRPNYQREWSSFFQHRLWNTVSIGKDKDMAAFWFVICGPFMALCGIALYELEVRGITSSLFGWIFLGMSILGAIMTPKSGFTALLIPQALFYLASVYSNSL